MRIYLIRHGMTEWNSLSRIQGREDIPLSPAGVSQIESLKEHIGGIKLSAVITSPLKRAVKTAEIIADGKIPIIKDEALIERDFGSVSGKVVDIFNPEKYADDLESLDDVANRMKRAILDHAKKLNCDFAAVSHGGSINALLRELSSGEIGSGKTRLKNACLNLLEYKNGTLSIIDFNLSAEEFSEKHAALRTD